MANSSSEQHIIPLEEPDLNLSRYDNDVKQYQGYNDRVGPYIGGESLPLNYHLINSPEGTIVGPDLMTYTIDDTGKFKCRDLNEANWTTLQENMTAVVITEISPTFTYNNQTYTGKVLGGTARLYGVWYNNYIYVIYNGEAIDKATNSVSYFDALKFWCIVEINNSFRNATIDTMICYFSGGYARVLTKNTGSSTFSFSTTSYYSVSRDDYDLTKPAIGKLLYDSGETGNSSDVIAWYSGLSLDGLIVLCVSGGSYFWKYDYSPDWLDDVYIIQSLPSDSSAPTLITIPRTSEYGGWFLCNGTDTQTFNNDLHVSGRIYYTVDMYYQVTSTSITWDNFVAASRLNSLPFPFVTVDDGTVPDYAASDDYYGKLQVPNKFNKYSIERTIAYRDDLENFDRTMVLALRYPNTYGTNPNYLNKDDPTVGLGEIIYPFNDTRLYLINDGGYLSTVAVKGVDDPDYTGNIVLPWGSVEDVFVSQAYNQPNEIGVKVSGKWHSISLSTSQKPSMTVYKNRYIMINTSSFWNVYDMDDKVWMHAFDAWCNDIKITTWSTFTTDKNRINWQASQFMSDYLAENYPFPGRAWDAVMIRSADYSIDWYSGYKTGDPISYGQYGNSVPVHIDMYKTNVVNTNNKNELQELDYTPHYIYSNNGIVSDLIGQYWVAETGNALFNIPMFCKYNTTLITIASHQIATNVNIPLLTEGLVESAVYYLGSIESDIDHIFTIQTMPYGVSDNYISRISYENGIINIQGKCTETGTLDFKTANSALAYYWSKSNLNIYSFNGDGVLRPIKAANKLSSIDQSKYNPATQEIYMVTDIGLLVAHASYMYMIPISKFIPTNYTGYISDVFITEYGFATRVKINEINQDIVYSFSYYDKTKHTTTLPAVLETCFYGYSDHTITTTDCIYIRVFNPDIGMNNVTVKVSGKVMTDKYTELESDYVTYTITPSDWIDNTYYIRYQPSYQKGVGMSIRVESEVPITFLAFGSKPETLQITK